MLGVLATGAGSLGIAFCSAVSVSTCCSSTVLAIVSVSLAVDPSESALDPAYSVTDPIEGVSDVTDLVPASSRTRNCEMEGLTLAEGGEEDLAEGGEEDRVGDVSPLNGLAGRCCCARMSCSTLLSVLYRAVPNLALLLLLFLAGSLPKDALPPSSASSLISSRRVLESAGEAV
jgi:hypothetical protein